MNNIKDLPVWLGTIVGGCCTGISAATMDKIIIICNLAITILTTIVSLAYTIWKWYKKAKQDGKITEDEIDDLADEIHDSIKKDDKKED